MNSVNIIGRIGSDIELRSTPSGKPVAEVNLAVDDGYGENKKTAWIGVTMWGKTAEIASQYLSKGSQVGITGRLSQDEWTDKDSGKKQRKTKVTADNIYFIGRPKTEQSPAQDAHNTAKSNAYMPDVDDSESVPF